MEPSALSDLLQTCPYLTFVAAGDSSPIVYAIDELTPTAPDLRPPHRAAFGVIGLDRRVVWHTNPTALEVLEHAAREAASQRSLTERFGADVVLDLVRRRWLQAPSDLCRDYLLTTAQIEVTAHCNWSCGFCPVSTDRKPAATMTMPLFEEIVHKLSPHDTIRYVTFHFYNEPTLDRLFDERIAVLQAYGLRLRLFTNASHLTKQKVESLRRSGVLYRLVVNLPALNEAEFQMLTRSKTHAKTIRNLDIAIGSGLPIDIVVNGADEELDHRVAELRERYTAQGVSVEPTLVSDRAGTLDGPYHQAVRVEGPLTGCAWPVNHAHFSVNGDMFICCNDYYQRETFGNIRSGTVHELMTSAAAVRLRRRVFGISEAPADYLCRSCHDQLLDFPRRQFRPLASFPFRGRCGSQVTTHD